MHGAKIIFVPITFLIIHTGHAKQNAYMLQNRVFVVQTSRGLKNDRKGAPNVFLFEDFKSLKWFFRGTGKKRTPISSPGDSHVNGKDTLQAAVV